MEIGTRVKMTWTARFISAFVSCVAYTLILLLFNNFYDDEPSSTNNILLQGVGFGLFFGLGFPFLMEKFGSKKIKSVGTTIKPQLSENDTVEVDGPANLFRGMEGVGGRLFLTGDKIIFKSHKLNIQRGQTDIEYASISKFKTRKTGGIIDNGLRIITIDGKEYDFVVNEREVWIEKLQEKGLVLEN